MNIYYTACSMDCNKKCHSQYGSRDDVRCGRGTTSKEAASPQVNGFINYRS